MIIDDVTYGAILAKINPSVANPVHFNYTAYFTDEKQAVIPVHNLTNLHRLSKFNTAMADHLFVDLMMIKSEYFKLIGANRRLLQLHLTRTPNSIAGTNSRVGNAVTEVYNAYLTENSSEAIETRSGQLTGNYTDDLGELVEIDVQLVELGLSEFRLWDIGGVYRNVTIGNLLQGLMSQPLKAKGPNGSPGYNVTLYPPDNKEIYYQLVVPNGVGLSDLPGWVQKQWGVYSSGLGYYLYQGMWYLYPLYDTSRYAKAKKRLTIVNVPSNEMHGNTHSYVLENDELFILATGKTKHEDTADRLMDLSGTGFKAAKMDNLVDKFHDSANGETIVPKGRNLMAVSFEQREGELTHIKAVNGLFTSNVWEASSNSIVNMGNIVVVAWENSNPSLLYPGMPIRFTYKYRGVAYALNGALLAVDTKVQTYMGNLTDEQYVSKSILTLYTERATR